MVPEIIARLGDRVPQLEGRIEPAAAFAEMVARNQFPQHTPAVNVIPLAFQGGSEEVMTGVFRQPLDQVVAIILTMRTNTATGARALSAVDQLLREVMEAIAGWTPDEGTVGLFRLVRGGLVHTGPGLLVYQLDFAISDQLRIPA